LIDEYFHFTGNFAGDSIKVIPYRFRKLFFPLLINDSGADYDGKHPNNENKGCNPSLDRLFLVPYCHD
jgi:hypothetical protein